MPLSPSRTASSLACSLLGVLTAALPTSPLQAQDEADHLPFQAPEAAFAEAERTGKRVLVYQDWPG